MKIVIPTYGRMNKQITLDSLSLLKEHIWLVVRPEEEDEARKIHHQVKVITYSVHHQGDTLEWIVKHGFPGELIWMVDDDLTFLERVKHADPLKETCSNIGQRVKPQIITEMWEMIQEYSKKYVHGGISTTVAPTHFDSLPHQLNSRYCTNKWYDLSKIDVNRVDWSAVSAAEDFWVMLELYEQGHDFVNITKYGSSGSPTNSVGGCSTYRTVEVHNDSMNKLQARFPEWVKLHEHEVESGPWKGETKLKARISVKRKFKQIINNTSNVNTFTNLFEVT